MRMLLQLVAYTALIAVTGPADAWTPDVGNTTGITLTAIADQRVFQRPAASTTGPVDLAGTYAGGTPSCVQGQVLLTSNSSIVVDWTTLSSATINAGAFSGRVLGVPQGGQYFAKVRPCGVPAVTATGVTNWYVGIILLLYGQSNMVNMDQVATVPPAAVAGTSYYDRNARGWVAVPNADGIRTLLNAVKTNTGIPTAAFMAAVSGSSLSGLNKGSSGYTDMLTTLAAVGGDVEMILWDQGEGDADASPHETENNYKGGVGSTSSTGGIYKLHNDMCADIGRTLANCPFVMSGLATTSIMDGTVDSGTTDLSWSTIKNAIYKSSIQDAFVYYSHHNQTAQRVDVYHYDGTSYGRQGAWFGQSVSFLLGSASALPNWNISSGAVVDGTHTNINVVHSLGTDFTPTSAGGGWEVSGNNGATWVTGTASRNSATQISITTGSTLSTSSARRVRYLWGVLPPNASGINPPSAPIVDNSSLAVPLNYTTWHIAPTPLSTVPIPTWLSTTELVNTTGNVYATIAVNLPPTTNQKLIVFAYGTGGGTIGGTGGSVLVTPRDFAGNPVGTAITATKIITQGQTEIFQALLLTDANSANAVDIVFTFSSNPSGAGLVTAWSIPFSDLSSTTCTTGGSSTSASLSGTATVNASAGGLILASGFTNTNYNETSADVIKGNETYAKRWENDFGNPTTAADASNVSANASSSVTFTFPLSGKVDLALASCR